MPRSGRPIRTRSIALLVLATALGGLLAGCGSDHRTAAPAGARAVAATTSPDTLSYVALGDSYTSAVGISPVAPGQTNRCGQSTLNYPRLVAASLGATLTDVSCPGARISDLLKGQRLGGVRLPPQLDVLSKRTDLVTLNIGANDLVLMGVLNTCVKHHEAKACRRHVTHVVDALATVPAPLAHLLAEIRVRAPLARLLVLGYPTIVGPDAPCAALPAPASMVAPAIGVVSVLNEDIKRAAEAAKATYIDLATPTEGHDICAADPWIAGKDGGGSTPFHPRAAEQRVVAEQVLAALK